MPLSETPDWIESNSNRTKGEFVLVLEPSDEKIKSNWKNLVQIMQKEKLSTKTISSIVSRHTGENKKNIPICSVPTKRKRAFHVIVKYPS